MQLASGLIVADRAVRLALRLEGDGFHLTVRDGMLWVEPKSRLTAADREAIRRDRFHLLAIVGGEA